MAKNKKLDAKLRLYYKGAMAKPTKVATDEGMGVIEEAFLECLPIRNTHSFRTTWKGQHAEMQMIAGLSSCLRHLKRGQTRALIYDDTAAAHTSGYLVEFGNKLNIPVVQASNLIMIAPKIDLKTMLVVSLVDQVTLRHDENLYSESDPKPKLRQECVEKESFNKLASFLQSTVDDKGDKLKFKQPSIVQVKSTGKSKIKKEFRKGERQSKRSQNLKTKQARGES